MYKNILDRQLKEYRFYYNQLNKKLPFKSKEEKSKLAIRLMFKARNIEKEDALSACLDPFAHGETYQHQVECVATDYELKGRIPRYYLKDDSLIDFFKETEIKQKEVLSILNSDFVKESENFVFFCGVLGKKTSFTFFISPTKAGHLFTILTEEMNFTFLAEAIDLSKQDENKWAFNMVMNFLFYITAFPECVVDGVPNGVKRQAKAKVISTSEKIVSHTTTEHGFVRPHFRRGYFRHLESDYFVNCKGQVRFISSTMVKGKAKTVLSK